LNLLFEIALKQIGIVLTWDIRTRRQSTSSLLNDQFQQGSIEKTTLIKQYSEKRFESRYLPTIGVDFGVKDINDSLVAIAFLGPGR
jgi:hypothetical protein